LICRALCSHKLGDCFVHLFKGGARRAGEKTPFFFLQSFFFWGYLLKRKSVKGILVSIDSATNYSKHLSFIHFFFGTIGAKKKFPKRNAECAHAAQAPLLKKWTKQSTGGLLTKHRAIRAVLCF
jgi:hypothetical protein